MAYNKPGVEVSQVQTTSSTILTTPDLEGVVVGNAFHWQDITWDSEDSQHNSVLATKFTSDGSPMTFNLSAINSEFNDILAGDGDLVIVDLLGVSGVSTGITLHLEIGDDFSVDETSNSVTISGMTETDGETDYLVKVGYRAARPGAVGYNVITSSSEIAEILGEPVSWNPLAYGVNMAMNNSATSFNALGVAWAASPGTAAIDAINDILSLKDVFVIAPVTHNIDAASLKTHCDTYALPENKKERVAFVNTVITYPGDPTTLTSTQRATLSASIRDASTAIGSKRVYTIHPDLGYELETRHISTIKPSWINKSFDYFTTIDFSTYGPYAQFVSDVIVGGIKYKAGQNITEAVWRKLMDNNWAGSSGMVTVYAPIPGFYYTAREAGQVIGTGPSQSLTNVAGSGFAKTFGSQDIFSEANLNTMAEGGTWIMTQDSTYGPLYCRHQMSTDITSVAKREMSVVKSIDYVSKFLRKILKPYIGKFNITNDFLDLLNSILYGGGKFLVKLNVIRDLKILSVAQDELEQDVINVEVNVLPLYPVNYIKIKLTF